MEDPRFSPNPRFFARTDLSLSLSKAKFDEQADFEVHLAVALQKPRQIDKKRDFRSENFAETKNFGVEKGNVQNLLKRILAKFRADPSHIQRVTKKIPPPPTEMN